jgi:hypothetical protein
MAFQQSLFMKSKLRTALLLTFALSSIATRPQLLLASDEGLTAEEKESLQQTKNPEQRLKLYLGIAEVRLKEIVLYTHKLDKENSAKAVSGFRAAVSGADDCVAKEQSGRDYRKLITHLHKAVKQYNFALVQALQKVAEDFRSYIQSAYEVSQRVQNSAEIQLARYR